MARIYNNVAELIGHTPLVRLHKTEQMYGLKAALVAKVEFFNPGGSSKDRIGLSMIAQAEECGLLQPGGLIVEPTSGNTGVGLALVAAIKGYRAIFTMPDNMSIERRKLLSALGAEIVLTPAAEGMAGSIRKAQEIAQSNPGSFLPLQFENPSNPAIHAQTTAQEIWQDTDGTVDIFVAGVGTGGTISGTAQGLKQHNSNIRAVAVEPASSAVISTGVAGPHKIQGIGGGFVPKNYYADLIDQVIAVTDSDALSAARLVAKTEGLLVGISSGAALHAAITLASLPDNQGKTIVALLPDTGERYLSTYLYQI